MGNLKYSALIDYVLMTLNYVRRHRPQAYISLPLLMEIFEHNASFSEIVELGKYLEARGWAKAIYPLGDVRVQITTSGVLYLEDKEPGLIEEYEKFRDEKNSKSPDGEIYIKLYKEDDNPKERLLILIEKIKDKIIKRDGNNDLVNDLEIIRLELTKITPDFNLIESKLNTLSQLSYVSSEIQELKAYLLSS